MSPPRLSAARKLAEMPALKGRIEKSWRRNIGAAARRSTRANSTITARPTTRHPSTTGLVQPIV